MFLEKVGFELWFKCLYCHNRFVDLQQKQQQQQQQQQQQ